MVLLPNSSSPLTAALTACFAEGRSCSVIINVSAALIDFHFHVIRSIIGNDLTGHRNYPGRGWQLHQCILQTGVRKDSEKNARPVSLFRGPAAGHLAHAWPGS